MNEMERITTSSQKRKYGLFSNFMYYMKLMKEWNQWMFYSQIFVALPTVIASILGTLLPASLINGLEQQGTIIDVLLPLFFIAAAMMMFNMLKSVMEEYNLEQSDYLSLHYMDKYVSKVVNVDYQKMEDKKFKPVMESAWASARFGKGLWNANQTIPTLMISTLAILIYGVILIKSSVFLLGLIIISVSIDLYLLKVARRMHKKYFGKISKYAKGEEYITKQSMEPAAGKDIRIYKMLDFIIKKYDENLKQIDMLYGKIHNWYFFRNLSGAVFGLIRDSFAYILLINYLITGRINASEFVFYIGVIANFSHYLEYFLRAIMELNSINSSISYVREFLETESIWSNHKGVGKATIEKFKKKGIKLELRNITFTYQGSSKPTIKNLNLIIEPGEKLALIGLNGAGKTTLVKLISGLYLPDEGEIYLNNIPRQQYTREEYFSLISVLFQETTLLPLSVDENITSQERWDTKRLNDVLKLSGFEEKYNHLPQKGSTKLIKEVEETAVDFSGGEKQKLLFARALYQEAPLVILDEPTAALDPIAENELYVNFGNSMKNRTSIYISHRLSSTRFCDRIILLEHGQLVEEGTHEELLEKNGRYARLFEMQSHYYKKQEEQKQKSFIMGDEYIEDEYIKLEKGGIFHE